MVSYQEIAQYVKDRYEDDPDISSRALNHAINDEAYRRVLREVEREGYKTYTDSDKGWSFICGKKDGKTLIVKPRVTTRNFLTWQALANRFIEDRILMGNFDCYEEWSYIITPDRTWMYVVTDDDEIPNSDYARLLIFTQKNGKGWECIFDNHNRPIPLDKDHKPKRYTCTTSEPVRKRARKFLG